MTTSRSPAGAPASDRFLAGCCALLLVWTAGLGWRPVDRSTWLLENLLVVALLLALFASWRRHPLSRGSLIAIFAFLFVHEVGAHYTYSLVPWDAWLERIFGASPSALAGFERNHFDRAIHLLYGFVFFFPAREVLLRDTAVPAWVAVALPVDWILSTSALYELIEWGAAAIFGGDLGMRYLGTQGDVWDAHKDVALALLGAGVAAGGVALSARVRRARVPAARVGAVAPAPEATGTRATRGPAGAGNGST